MLTSGRGDRVYFSEAFIVFTSNLGIYRLEADGTRVANVTPEDAFPVVQARVRAEIERHFKTVLNRPEILNRIGENVLVFDFVRAGVAAEILEGMVGSFIRDLEATQGIELTLTEGARTRLAELALSDLSNGGRGIRNKVEAHLANPLARALFDADAKAGEHWVVTAMEPDTTGVTTLRISKATGAGAFAA